MANTNQYWDFKPEVFVSKDQGQIELFVRGEGPPLILLHELPGQSDTMAVLQAAPQHPWSRAKGYVRVYRM